MMMRTMGPALLALGLLGLSACGESDPMNMPEDDAGPVIEPACSPPEPPYGVQLGNNVRPFTLNDCNNVEWEMYGEQEGFCDASFTLIIMAAGWCVPCQREAEEIGRGVLDSYKDQGVRVITAMIQSEDRRAPTEADCDGWVNEYNLLGETVLYDPQQEIVNNFAETSLPGNAIVDSRGRLVHEEHGFSTALGTIRGTLDDLLADLEE
ncbi:MAG: peroxiredoxin family protein [Sandaracinaceae bacterium]